MSLYPIIWAVEHAPIVDAEERAILVALVTKGDFDGCNCYRSFATLARVARVDRRTAMRKVQAMTDRGLLREQKDPKPKSWYDLPADKRPVVREAMIPASFWSTVQLAEINEQRATRGRAPITGANRPDLAEAPPKKVRADKGKPNPKRSNKKPTGERGDFKSPRPEGSGVSQSHPAECLEDTSRGVFESPNLPMGPSDIPSSSSAEVEDITSVAVTTATTKRKNESPEEIVIERTGCTPEEAVAVVDLIETQGDDGKPIRRIVPWVRGRTDRDLQRDLAQVRRHSAAPTVTECGIHACEMKPYGCDACAGEAKGGDAEDRDRLRAHLAAVGEKTRPDLARLLGAPQRPAGASFDRDPAAYYRGINKAHQDPRYAPATGSYVDPDTVYTEDPKVVFGTSRPKRPQDVTGALAPVVTAEQIRNNTDDFRL